MKKVFTLLTLALMSIGSAWGDDLTLFSTDFTDAKYNVTYPTKQYDNVTVDDNGTTVTIQGYKDNAFSYSSTDGITCTSNNLSASKGDVSSNNPNYFIGIPLTGVNGRITVTTKGDATKWYYAYTTDADQKKVTDRLQAAANGGFEITGLTNSNVTLYICSKGKKLKTITIKTKNPADKTELVGSWSNAALSCNTGDTPSIPTFSVKEGTKGTDYSVAYSVVSGTLATVDASTGITAINTAEPGTAVVKATVTVLNTSDYQATTTEYNCIINVLRTLAAVALPTWWDFSSSEFTSDVNLSSALASNYVSAQNIEFADGMKISQLIDGDDNPTTVTGYGNTFGYYADPNGYAQNTAGKHRYVHFKVGGNCKITVYGQTGKTSEARNFGIKTGSMVYDKNTSSASAYVTHVGNGVGRLEYIYTGGATDVYVYAIDANCRFFGIKVEAIPTTASVTIGSTGWATFSCSQPLDFSSAISGLTAYQVTDVAGSTVKVAPVTSVVPAYTGLLLEGAANTYTIPVASTAGEALSENKLVAGTGATVSAEEGKTKYVLGKNGSNAVFQRINANAAVVPAGKAYLLINSVISAPMLDFNFDGNTTAIETIKKASGEGAVYYNLNGQRIAQPTKGLYIVNGRKYIVK